MSDIGRTWPDVVHEHAQVGFVLALSATLLVVFFVSIVFLVVEYRRATDPPSHAFAAFSLLKPDASGFRPFDTARNGFTVAAMMRHAVGADGIAPLASYTLTLADLATAMLDSPSSVPSRPQGRRAIVDISPIRGSSPQ